MELLLLNRCPRHNLQLYRHNVDIELCESFNAHHRD